MDREHHAIYAVPNLPNVKEPTIFTDKYRIAALKRGNRAHIDWTSNHQNLNSESKVGDEVWIYPETPPHLGLFCVIEKIDIKRTRRYGTLMKVTACPIQDC